MIKHDKIASPIENLRKPASRVIAIAFVLIALFSVPRGFGSAWMAAVETAGGLLLIAAALGRVWCAIYISGRKDRILCQDGPYSLCRNPLYFFSFLGAFGFFAAVGNPVLAAAAALVYLGYYRFVIRSEEIRLAQLFGADYAAYAATTPRFFPALRHPRTVESYTINPKIIERALREVVWFLVAILAANALERIHQSGAMIFFRLPF